MSVSRKRVRALAGRLYTASPKQVIRVVKNRARTRLARKPPPEAVTLEFLRSSEYQALMNRHVPYDNAYGLHEAQTATKSFMFRAFQVHDRLRAYRWRGVQENLETFLDLLGDPAKLVVDLGGAASSFGLASVIVDTLRHDVDGRKVPYSSLDQLPRPADGIVSSHTLEHIPDLEAELERIARSLVAGGTFLVLVPAFSCERWRAGTHTHASFGDHVWTFGLSGTPDVPAGLNNYVEIDELLKKYFVLDYAAYCGDDSIFAVCRTR